jgi:predicted PurR-regulated permease PerM
VRTLLISVPGLATVRGDDLSKKARDTFVITLVAVGVVVGVLVLWKLRLLFSLIFVGIILAAAMRPGVEALHRHRIPRGIGVLLHYAVLLGALALLVWLLVPTALDQTQEALGPVPTSQEELERAARNSHGLRHEFLTYIDSRLEGTQTWASAVGPAVELSRKAVEILVGVLFVFAIAGYWIFDRERAESVVFSMVPRSKRPVVHETWLLVDAKLGAYVRRMLLMIAFVGTVLSLSFWQIGLPFWLLLGVFCGVVEIIPVIGPLVAGLAAVAVGLTVSWQHAALAAVAVYGLRLLQDYVINPRMFGHAVGLAPLVVLVTVSAVGLALGPAAVPLATPFAAVVATLIDVFVRGRDPAKEEVPTILPTEPRARASGGS